jgi:hypothetical protein
MSRHDSRLDCGEVSFHATYHLEPPAQVGLEDYARVLTGAAAADVIEDAGGAVTGVHLCGLGQPVSERAAADILAFARDLQAASPGGGGLGWS